MANLLDRAVEGRFEAWRRVARSTPGGELEEGTGFLISSMGSPWASNNRGVVARPLADARAGVGAIAEFFKKRSLEFVLQLDEGLPADHIRAARDAGLTESFRGPVMVLEHIDLLTPGTVDGCEIREVRDTEELALAADAAAKGFGSEGSRSFATDSLAASGMRYFVGMIDRAVVATSLVFPHDGAAGIFFVSTVPEFRRRGLGEALTAAAVKCGADQGCDIAYLEASELGYPVYQRMGFTTVGRTIGFRG